jgi:hypothetical protein
MLYAVAGESGIALAEIVASEGKSSACLRPLAMVGRRARWLLWRLRRMVPHLPGANASANKVFIAGCARSGTTLSVSLMTCFEDTFVHSGEAPYQFLMQLDRPERNHVVKRTWVSHADLDDLPVSVGLVYCVRHPFDVLTSSHPETVHVRRFHVTMERWEAEYDGLIRLRQAQPQRVISYLRYEDLVDNPDIAQARIAGLFGLVPTKLFSRDANNPIRKTSLRKWERNEEFRAYLESLPRRFLDRVEAFCREFGYEMPAGRQRVGLAQ